MTIETTTPTGITTSGQYATSVRLDGGRVVLRAWNVYTQTYAEMDLRCEWPDRQMLASIGPRGREIVERGMAAAAFGRDGNFDCV